MPDLVDYDGVTKYYIIMFKILAFVGYFLVLCYFSFTSVFIKLFYCYLLYTSTDLPLYTNNIYSI